MEFSLSPRIPVHACTYRRGFIICKLYVLALKLCDLSWAVAAECAFTASARLSFVLLSRGHPKGASFRAPPCRIRDGRVFTTASTNTLLGLTFPL